jgi:hypothetical protein
MTINLTSYASVESGLFVKIVCDYYKPTFATASFTSQTFYFSDMMRDITLDSNLYTGIGRLLGVTTTSSELKVSNQEVTITLSGIPNSALEEIQASRFKGSNIEIRRGIFNANTGAFLSISGNPMLRFKGIITNLSINEEYSIEDRTATNTITLACASVIDVMSSKISGRKTNPESQKYYYTSDVSMDRVPSLVGTYFDFGGKS